MAKTVTLEASPPPTYLRFGQGKTIDINAHVNSDSLTAVQLDLVYDSTKLKIEDLTPTDYLPTILSQPVYEPGHITATYAVPPESQGRTSSWGTVATLTLTPLSYGSSTIVFGPNTLAAATSSYDDNVLIPPNPINTYTYNIADINQDGFINILDYNNFVTQYGITQLPVAGPADFDRNGKVDIFDYNLLVINFTR